MKNAFCLLFISVLAAPVALPQAGAPAADKKPAVKKAVTKKPAAATSVPTSKKPATTKPATTKKAATKKAAPPAQTWRNRQAVPTKARYQEIQQALADRGFLKQEPNGVWDSQSEEALKAFQAEQKLQPTGKINAPSLIGLGLGPKPPEPITVPPGMPGPEPAIPVPAQ